MARATQAPARTRLGRRASALAILALLVASCGSSGPTPAPIASILGATATPTNAPPATASNTPTDTPTDGPSGSPSEATASPTATASPSPVARGADGLPSGPTSTPAGPNVTVSIVAAGDIACDPAHNTGTPQDCDQAATAALIGQLHPTAVLPLGDLQYEDGTLAAFRSVFGQTWGKYRSIMYPAIGNHEYLTSGAAGYFGYFGRIPAYYSYDLGDWHMVSLDSECHYVGGCQAGSAQEKWLLADLAAHPNMCTLVYWHEPRWSSGEHGNASQMVQVWKDLVAYHVDVVLTGHNHDYERFVPLNGAGQPDSNGVTEFVVGTGGKNHYGFTGPALNGEVVRNDSSFGVLKMLLGPSGYSWRFYPAPGYSFTDSGSANCH
jgi:hypothetical protein